MIILVEKNIDILLLKKYSNIITKIFVVTLIFLMVHVNKILLSYKL